jgi:hypothetical protein
MPKLSYKTLILLFFIAQPVMAQGMFGFSGKNFCSGHAGQYSERNGPWQADPRNPSVGNLTVFATCIKTDGKAEYATYIRRGVSNPDAVIGQIASNRPSMANIRNNVGGKFTPSRDPVGSNPLQTHMQKYLPN